MVTCMSVYQPKNLNQDCLIAVATIQNSAKKENEGKLKGIHILRVNRTTSKIEPVCYMDFGWH